MIKLVGKIFLLIGITFLLAFFIRMPIATYWHSPPMQAKYDYLCENPHKFDFVFMGTSRIARGLDPIIFDKKFNTLSDKKFKSFNYATAGTTLGENIALLNDLLAIKNLKTNYIIYELNSVHNGVGKNISEENLHTIRVNYWLNPSLFFLSIKNVLSFRSEIYDYTDRVRLIKNYTVGFFENMLNVGMLESILLGHKGKEYNSVKYNLDKNRGFKSYKGKKKNGNRKQKEKWTNDYIKPYLNKSRKAANTLFNEQKWANESISNKNYFYLLQELIAKCEKKGIRLIFLLPPMLKEEILYEIAPIYNALPKQNKIELANPNKYKPLYSASNAFDAIHLNKNGSEFFSNFTAEQVYNLYNQLK